MKSRNGSRCPYGATVGLAIALIGCGSAELEDENRRLTDELSAIQAEHQELEARFAELERSNREMLERLRAAGVEVESLEGRRAALAAELEAARRREQQQRERLQAFRGMLQQFREMIASGQLRVR